MATLPRRTCGAMSRRIAVALAALTLQSGPGTYSYRNGCRARAYGRPNKHRLFYVGRNTSNTSPGTIAVRVSNGDCPE